MYEQIAQYPGIDPMLEVVLLLFVVMLVLILAVWAFKALFWTEIVKNRKYTAFELALLRQLEVMNWIRNIRKMSQNRRETEKPADSDRSANQGTHFKKPSKSGNSPKSDIKKCWICGRTSQDIEKLGILKPLQNKLDEHEPECSKASTIFSISVYFGFDCKGELRINIDLCMVCINLLEIDPMVAQSGEIPRCSTLGNPPYSIYSGIKDYNKIGINGGKL